MRCDLCEGNHANGFYHMPYSSHSAKVNYMGNQGRQQLFNNSFPNFNQGWRQNNSNFGGKQDEASRSGGHHQQFPPLYERVNKLKEKF